MGDRNFLTHLTVAISRQPEKLAFQCDISQKLLDRAILSALSPYFNRNVRHDFGDSITSN